MALPISKPYIGPAPVSDIAPGPGDWGQYCWIVGGSIDASFGTATRSQVPASLVSVVLLPANLNRKAALFFNESASAFLYLTYGATSSTADFTVRLGPRGYHEIPSPGLYNGVVSGIWTAAVGFCAITEVTPP